KAEIDQGGATNRGFMSTGPNLRLMTAEHVRPMWEGGRSVAGNVVAACYACNHARSGELNQTKRGSKFTIGDDTLSSPSLCRGCCYDLVIVLSPRVAPATRKQPRAR